MNCLFSFSKGDLKLNRPLVKQMEQYLSQNLVNNMQWKRHMMLNGQSFEKDNMNVIENFFKWKFEVHQVISLADCVVVKRDLLGYLSSSYTSY